MMHPASLLRVGQQRQHDLEQSAPSPFACSFKKASGSEEKKQGRWRRKEGRDETGYEQTKDTGDGEKYRIKGLDKERHEGDK